MQPPSLGCSREFLVTSRRPVNRLACRALQGWLAAFAGRLESQKMKQLELLALAGLLLCAPAWAVNKCTAPDGKVTYQAQACPFTGSGAVLYPGRRVVVVVPDPEALSAIKPDAMAPAAPAAPVAVGPDAGAARPLSALEREAETCLNYIKPMLKDPGSPYYQAVRKEGTVLSFDLYAKNSYGGYTSKPAACEIKNSLLDAGWTQIHLKRLGWFTP